jgi:hypothetical protein
LIDSNAILIDPFELLIDSNAILIDPFELLIDPNAILIDPFEVSCLLGRSLYRLAVYRQ